MKPIVVNSILSCTSSRQLVQVVKNCVRKTLLSLLHPC